MCIVAFAWQILEDMPLCLISNRDEFYHRPASQLHIWPESPIIAGQDLESGGTWLGCTASGRWAVVTNFRDARDRTQYPTSRGHLIESFLNSDVMPIRFAQALEDTQQEYAGFNLFIGDREQAVYMSNRGEPPQILPKGVYAVSNGLMSDSWEKVHHFRKRFTQEMLPMLQYERNRAAIESTALDILEDERKLDAVLLPDTGISVEMEQLLSSTFIQSPVYGTRCSNFIHMKSDRVEWLEKTQQGEYKDQIVRQSFLLK